jgi:hypothetical protein
MATGRPASTAIASSARSRASTDAARPWSRTARRRRRSSPRRRRAARHRWCRPRRPASGRSRWRGAVARAPCAATPGGIASIARGRGTRRAAWRRRRLRRTPIHVRMARLVGAPMAVGVNVQPGRVVVDGHGEPARARGNRALAARLGRIRAPPRPGFPAGGPTSASRGGLTRAVPQ